MHSVVANAERKIVAAVDDDRRVRESMENLMESAGYAAATFSSGEEFPRSGSLATTTCVITDVWIPGIVRIEVQRRIGWSVRNGQRALSPGAALKRDKEP